MRNFESIVFEWTQTQCNFQICFCEKKTIRERFFFWIVFKILIFAYHHLQQKIHSDLFILMGKLDNKLTLEFLKINKINFTMW